MGELNIGSIIIMTGLKSNRLSIILKKCCTKSMITYYKCLYYSVSNKCITISNVALDGGLYKFIK